jgi:serine/threonine-protein kinase
MTPGEQLTSSLTLVRCLAQGGVSGIWVAEHQGLGVNVAVKIMPQIVATDGQMVESLRREALAAAKLDSPHVAQVFEQGVTEDGRPYIVMELLEGEDLSRRIDRLQRLDPREVVEIIRQVGEALTRAHKLEIIHRNIKSSKIFIQSRDGAVQIKVLDFGVAKLPSKREHDVSISGFLVGTPFYMSPEQLKNSRRVTTQSDLWSLAVVAYQALTGVFPFHGRSLPELFMSVNGGKFAPPTERRSDLPPTVDAWFERALSRDPSARFTSAREMAIALEVAITGSYVPRGSDPPAPAPQPSEAPSAPSPSPPPAPSDEPASALETAAPAPALKKDIELPRASRWIVPALVLVTVLIGALVVIVAR